MPNRIIRENILASDRVCALKWDEEVFYRRLMSVVDDYGRFEAKPELLRSKCYPLQVDKVRVSDISRWMAACQIAGLILFYCNNLKCFLEIKNFGQNTRTPSKFPDPCEQMISNASKCLQMKSNVPVFVFVSVFEDVCANRQNQPGLDAPANPSGLAESVTGKSLNNAEKAMSIYEVYPRKVGRSEALKSIEKALKKGEMNFDEILVKTRAFAESQSGKEVQYIPHPSTWFNQGRYLDEVASYKNEISTAPKRETQIEWHS